MASHVKKLISKSSLLSNEEKKPEIQQPTTQGEKFLAQIRDGNVESVKKLLDQNPEIVNFPNAYGVTALMEAIEKENNDLVRYLIERDADVNAVSKNNIHKETPLSRAAKTKNRPIVNLLVEKGAEIQLALNCICNPQVGSHWVNDEKSFSLTGVRMLVSPQILAATREPILTAFSVSNKLYTLAKRREEYRDVYNALAVECEQFAHNFLDQCENLWEARRVLSKEVRIIDKAMDGSKKEFVAHPFVQCLLKEQNFGKFMNCSMWGQFLLVLYWFTSVLWFPYYAILYILSGRNRKLKYSYLGIYMEFMKTPILCLIADTISYIFCFALLIKICVGTDELPKDWTDPRCYYEYILWACVIGQVYTEGIQLRRLGGKNYFTNFWNIMDLTIIIFLFCSLILRVYTMARQSYVPESNIDPDLTKYLQTTSGIIYGTIGLVQTIKFLSITDASYILGPLQLAMKSMMRDLMLICIMLIVVIFAFSLAIYVTFQQLPVMYGVGTAIPVGFSNLAQTISTLFWSLFGLIDFIIDVRAAESGKETIFVVFYLLYAAYLMLSAILLLNMLIAMLTTTFERIQHQSDVEWKFARALMLRGYSGGQSYPSPFNMMTHAVSALFFTIYKSCCSKGPKLGVQCEDANQMDQYREKLIRELRKRYYVGRNIVVGKKVGGLIDQYNSMVHGKDDPDKGPSRPKRDNALDTLTKESGGMYNPKLKNSNTGLNKK